MNRLEAITTARAKIADPKDWTRGYLTRKGRICAWEALRSTIVGGKAWGNPDPLAADELKQSAALFRPLIPADRRNPESNFHPLIQFNDHKLTTHAEVVGLFDQVIEGLQP